MSWIAGVDGFKHRWCVVLQNLATDEPEVRIASTFAELPSLPDQPTP